MPISYQAALRVYAKKMGKFMVPKKGSSEYDEVRKIMGETEMSSEHEIKRRSKKAVSEPVVAKEKKVRKSKKKSIDEVSALYASSSGDEKVSSKKDMVPPPMKNDTKLIDDPADELKGKKIIKNDIKIKPKKSSKGVDRTGKPESINDTNMLINSNTGPSAVISAELPGQKEQIKKALKEGKKDKTLIEVKKAKDETIKNMKTDDAVALEGEGVQFSFQALRNKLLC